MNSEAIKTIKRLDANVFRADNEPVTVDIKQNLINALAPQLGIEPEKELRKTEIKDKNGHYPRSRKTRQEAVCHRHWHRHLYVTMVQA